jgi:large subunit ribosomal protein L25
MEATLEAVMRTTRGKNEARRLRVAGQIPAVVYGTKKDGQLPTGTSVAVNPKEVLRILRSESGVNSIIKLTLDGAESQVLVREYQLDPVTSALLHADFYQLAMDKLLVVAVPIVVQGEPKGVKLQGGLLDFVTREIQVQCLPADIPEHINLDVTGLELHGSIRVRELVIDGKWKPLTDGETMLVHIVLPKAEESAQAATETAAPGAAAEPEVAKKGKPEKADEKEKK